MSSRRRTSARLRVEPLEDRITPANPDLVANTLGSIPSAATVKIWMVYDLDGNKKPSPHGEGGDTWFHGSGAMISDYHVLTCAHNVFDRPGSEVRPGKTGPDFVFVYAAQNTVEFRPFGEAEATHWEVVPQYKTASDANQFKHDLAVLTLDRNLGKFTGTYNYEAVSRATLEAAEHKMFHYPAEDGFDGTTQQFSDGRTAQVHRHTIEYREGDEDSGMFAARGSSGSPVFLNGTHNGETFSKTIIGILVAGVPGRDDPDDTIEVQRLTDDDIDFIDDYLDDRPRPTDRADLVDWDKWFNANLSTLDRSTAQVGQSITVSAEVYNAGTAGASNVTVRFALSTNKTFGSADRVLGDATISSLDPFRPGTATLTATIPPDLAAGEYHVVWSIDPDGEVSEYGTPLTRIERAFDEDTGRHPIQLRVRTAPAGDRFEANGSISTATDFGRPANRVEAGLTIHAAGDNDFFKFVARATGTATVRLGFTHAQGNLDVEVFRGGNLLTKSDSTTNEELATFNVVAGETYLVRVFEFNGNTSGQYTITVATPAGAAADANESNDTPATATNLGTLGGIAILIEEDLSIHTATDEDFFTFTAGDGGTAVITVDFTHTQGDLDLEVTDAVTGEVFLSQGEVDDEELSIGVVAGRTYTVRVFEFNGDISPNYELVVTFIETEPEPTLPPPPPPPPPGDGALLVGGQAGGAAVRFNPNAAGQYGSPVTLLMPFGAVPTAVRTAAADVNGDGVLDSILVTGPGTPLRVAVVSGTDHTTLLVAPFDPFGDDFIGGGFVTAAKLDADNRAEFVITPDEGGGTRVTVFSLTDTGLVTRANFFGIDDVNFRGGVRAALGDVNGDGTADVIVAAGFGGGPRTAIFTGQSVLAGGRTRMVNDFFAFPGEDAARLRNGAYVAVGDVDGDDFADLVFGGGPGGAPRVFVLSGSTLTTRTVAAAQANPVANFFVAGNDRDRGGVRVGVKNADGDDTADVVVGSGDGSPSNVRVYLGKNFDADTEPTTFQDFNPFGGLVPGGVFVG